MAKDGITALTKSLAAIYYLPFQCVSSLSFPKPPQEVACILQGCPVPLDGQIILSWVIYVPL